MLIRISDTQFCAWLNNGNHEKLLEEWPDIPPRMRVGSLAIGMVFGNKVFKKDDPIIYVGKKLLISSDNDRKRQIRLVLVGGQVGFIEGYDVKYFEPFEKNDCTSLN